MKKPILSILIVVTILSTTVVADGSYVAGDSYSLAPDGSYVGY